MTDTLLLADDSVTIQRVIELTFANEGVRVLTAADGHAATARLEDSRPDIVLADVGLPGVDGYVLAERVKRSAALSTVPVLLLTGAFEPIDETRVRASGCDGVLVKPFDPKGLVALVKALLAGERPDNLWPADMPRSDVRRDIEELPSTPVEDAPRTSETPAPGRGRSSQDVPPVVLEDPEWDLPAPSPTVGPPVAAPSVPEPVNVTPVLPVAPPSLATAFSALLAAEQAQSMAHPSQSSVSAISEAAVEEVVRRVVTRMTDEVMRKVVMEMADRLIREEIDRLKQ